jgi:HAD superfamily hydrolase (TIGR01509 family)
MNGFPAGKVPGAVFDLDGVLIDSHDQHERSWFMLADELGRPLTRELFKESFGMRNEMVIPGVFGWAGADETERILELGERKEQLYRKLLAEESLEPLPGVVNLLNTLRSAGIPCSLGSSTSRKNIEICLGTTGLAEFFGEAVTGAEDVSRGKPDPEVFVAAAARIARDARECFVIEDAHVGIEAGIAAGMKTIAVTTTHPAKSFGDDPDLIVESLVELDLEKIGNLFS